MGKENKLHMRDLAFVIEEAIRQLRDGETRLAVSDYPLSHACLNDLYKPDFEEWVLSYSETSSGNEDITKDYYEEITTIEKLMVDAEVPIKFADWQSKSNLESLEKIHKGLNLRAYSMQLWDWYAIPWRYKNGFIHLIWSPHDIMGSPIIHSYPASYFLSNLAAKLETEFSQFQRTSRQLTIWKNLGIIILIVMGIIVWALIEGLFTK